MDTSFGRQTVGMDLEMLNYLTRTIGEMQVSEDKTQR